MTTETILTHEQITEQFEWYVDDPEHTNTFMVFARAIEQAVLQSLPVLTSSAIRGDSYAGVYVWIGDENIVQHIPKVLAQTANDPQSILGVVADKCIQELKRFSELQPPEVQAWKRDAELFQFLLEEAWFQRAFDRFDPVDNGNQNEFELECRRILSAAMENQT